MTVSAFIKSRQPLLEATQQNQSTVSQETSAAMAHPDTTSSPSNGQTLFKSFAGVLNLFRTFKKTPTVLGVSTLTAVLTCMLGVISEAAALDLRVAIEEDVRTVQVGSSTKSLLRDSSGRVVAEIPAMGSVRAEFQGNQVKIHQFQGRQFWLEPTNGGYVAIGDKWYRGKTHVIAVDGAITAVNYVNLEEYLYSVVGGEVPTNWPLEAMKAQAVAARTYALYQRQSRGNAIFDVGDTTAWQVYRGLEEEASSTHAAVRETAGQVLTHNGQIIEAVFHSSSGGHTENVENVWSSPRPYLRGVADFDHYAPVFQWREQFSADDLRNRITGVGRILSITPVQLTPTGRVASVRVVGDRSTRTLTGSEMRQSLGLRSTLFTIRPEMGRVASANSAGSVPVSFLVDGRGFGHGVGMSQWGAYGLASRGYNYQQILGHYFQNTTLSVIRAQ
ncbi:MAG: SpoIID/LytB domain-containing protein [Leptolyngbyaceae bacterium]|nr:SpoIID/LytB domain-containing protein [Leptolyngbyaceae bacterium]